MKFALTLLLFCFTMPYQVGAQNQKVLDSLENVYRSSNDDKHKLKISGDLCWSYGSTNFDKALFYGKAELQLAEKLKDSASIALAYSDIGNTYTRVNNLKEALAYHLKSYNLREKLGLKAKAAGSISNIAIIYKQMGNFKDALDYMHRSLKIYEAANDELRQALVLSNIGNVYMNYEKYSAAKESYDRVIILAKKNNSSSSLASAYSGLMKYYFQLKQYDKALQNGLLAARYLKQLDMKADLAAVENTIGQVYFEKGKYVEAMKYYSNSLEFRLFMKDKLGIASCYKNIGACYAELKDFPTAEQYVNQSIVLFKELNSKDYLREAYDILGDIYEAKQDYITSLKFFKESAAMKDSIYNKQSTDKINELQIAYQTEKKMQQIVLLNQENKIQKLVLFKRNIFLGVALAALVITILLGFLLYNSIKLKQAARLQAEVIKQQDMATKAVLNAEENERKRISGELHDGLGQMFSAVKMNLSALTEDLSFKNAQSEKMFSKTLNLIDESCKEVRSISHQMAPNVLLKSGLATAIRDFISKIDSRKLKIKLETFGLQERLDKSIETVLYRVIQETVNNVIKHAGANSLDIQLTKDEEGINAMIEDNGKGFDITQLEKFEGIGLKNIRSRVEYLKGTVDFSSSPGSGTLVAIYIPL
ncbi:sensor histidine kinase [Pedobacter frigiditerrae]|uniref:tetratricopeptide repeat-containing sensor histidine kinase n=1 Tax=Pedobacter frigiditerrae TaxID=2530452 RepID=UPI0029309834|nr:sensor histidine kinase [Pedobacter frigiditerrae]